MGEADQGPHWLCISVLSERLSRCSSHPLEKYPLDPFAGKVEEGRDPEDTGTGTWLNLLRNPWRHPQPGCLSSPVLGRRWERIPAGNFLPL